MFPCFHASTLPRSHPRAARCILAAWLPGRGGGWGWMGGWIPNRRGSVLVTLPLPPWVSHLPGGRPAPSPCCLPCLSGPGRNGGTACPPPARPVTCPIHTSFTYPPILSSLSVFLSCRLCLTPLPPSFPIHNVLEGDVHFSYPAHYFVHESYDVPGGSSLAIPARAGLAVTERAR